MAGVDVRYLLSIYPNVLRELCSLLRVRLGEGGLGDGRPALRTDCRRIDSSETVVRPFCSPSFPRL